MLVDGPWKLQVHFYIYIYICTRVKGCLSGLHVMRFLCCDSLHYSHPKCFFFIQIPKLINITGNLVLGGYQSMYAPSLTFIGGSVSCHGTTTTLSIGQILNATISYIGGSVELESCAYLDFDWFAPNATIEGDLKLDFSRGTTSNIVVCCLQYGSGRSALCTCFVCSYDQLMRLITFGKRFLREREKERSQGCYLLRLQSTMVVIAYTITHKNSHVGSLFSLAHSF